MDKEDAHIVIAMAKQSLTRAIIPDTAHNILICG